MSKSVDRRATTTKFLSKRQARQRQGKCGGDGPFPSRRREDRQPLNLSYESRSKTALGDKGRASHTKAKDRPRWPASSVVQTHGALQTTSQDRVQQ